MAPLPMLQPSKIPQGTKRQQHSSVGPARHTRQSMPFIVTESHQNTRLLPSFFQPSHKPTSSLFRFYPHTILASTKSHPLVHSSSAAPCLQSSPFRAPVSSLPALLPPIPAPCVLAEPYKDKRETSCDRNWLAPRVQVSSSLDRLDLPMGPCFDRPLNPAPIDHEVNSISALFLILTIGRRRASRFFSQYQPPHGRPLIYRVRVAPTRWPVSRPPCHQLFFTSPFQNPTNQPPRPRLAAA
ncbi:hypothetical protein CMEL01_02469 [Colletotrichum melonis]|uniref:Uncharacterized protein n=1 Tax=Colletotrichum melonis TaxID=1209925 RepID=A0AAI9UJ76_9PEZI|nr:hypothetical protein CMEL01_02469 [Colletotrichum melonis]